MKRNEARRFHVQEEIAAVACAVQNMYLTTTVYGIGGYWTTGGITYNEKAKAFFGLDEEDKLLGFFYLGYLERTIGDGYKRGDIREKVEWVGGRN